MLWLRARRRAAHGRRRNDKVGAPGAAGPEWRRSQVTAALLVVLLLASPAVSVATVDDEVVGSFYTKIRQLSCEARYDEALACARQLWAYVAPDSLETPSYSARSPSAATRPTTAEVTGLPATRGPTGCLSVELFRRSLSITGHVDLKGRT